MGSVRGLSCHSVATFSKLDNMNKLSNRLFLNIAGIFVGTLATFQTVSCVVEPTDHMHHVVARVAGQEAPSSDVSLFDFTTPGADVGGWIESSDTVRVPGKSKALMVLQKARLFQRAVFFALLNPQPNGAGFAGIMIGMICPVAKIVRVEYMYQSVFLSRFMKRKFLQKK